MYNKKIKICVLSLDKHKKKMLLTFQITTYNAIIISSTRPFQLLLFILILFVFMLIDKYITSIT